VAGVQLDGRDRWLVTHHRRRLAVAARFPLARQQQAADHLLQVATQQGRFQLMCIARCWRAQLS
jgi:hypothetical protein